MPPKQGFSLYGLESVGSVKEDDKKQRPERRLRCFQARLGYTVDAEPRIFKLNLGVLNLPFKVPFWLFRLLLGPFLQKEVKKRPFSTENHAFEACPALFESVLEAYPPKRGRFLRI